MDEHRMEKLLDDYRAGKRRPKLPDASTDAVAVEDTSSLGTQGALDTEAPPARPHLPNYEIVGEISRGGMGIVYRARDTNLDRPVAIKMVSGGLMAGPERITRFAGEARAIAKLDHPNIVKVYDVGEHQGQPYFSMELIRGDSLRDRLEGTPWQPVRAAQLMRQVAEAAHAAHQAGIVHRDLKPANILVSQGDGQAEVARIVDFGLAKNLDADALTMTGEALGTPSYMAPEQAAGHSARVGVAADIYSLGCVLYELLTGRSPFRAASVAETLRQITSDTPAAPRALNAQVPADLETICLKCLQKEPSQRYPSALALAEEISRFLGGRPIKARPTPKWKRVLKWCRRHPMAAALSGLTVVITIAGIMAWTRFTSQLANQTAIAVRETVRARESEQQALKAATAAENAADIQSEVMGFINEMTNELSTLGSQDRLYEALRASEQKVAKRLKHRPLPMAAYLLAMGDTLGQIGKTEEGLALIRRAKAVFVEHDGERSKNTTRAKLREFDLLNESRDLPAAKQLASELQEDGLEFFTQDRWAFRLILANMHINDGEHSAAERMLVEFVELMEQSEQPNQLQLLDAHQQLGVAMSHQGRFEEAGPHFEKRLQYARDNFPDGHEVVLAAENTYGVYLSNTGSPQEAVSIYRTALAKSLEKRGADHKRTIEMMQNMASALSRSKQYEEAKELYLTAIEYNLEHFGQANAYTLGAMINLTVDFLDLEQFEEGFSFLEGKCDVVALEEMRSPFAARLVLYYIRVCFGAEQWQRAGELLDTLERINASLPSPDAYFEEQIRAGRERVAGSA